MKALDPRLSFISFFDKTWYNATRNVVATPEFTFKPDSKADIIKIIQDAESKGRRVRAVGAGHSFSRVAEPARKDYFMEMFRLNACGLYEEALNPNALKHPTGEDRYFVKAQAGIRIKCLNKALNRIKESPGKRGFALDNMGAFDWQTVSGALSTGTHGTGIHQPAFPDMVRSLVIIGTGGLVTQYEPTDGITDPIAFKAKYGATIKLEQNDELFYSVVLGLGAMGIIYELVLEVSPTYWIKENRTIVDWDSELKPQLLNGYFKKLVEEQYDFVSFRVNPYKTYSKKLRKEVRLCALAMQKKYKWSERPPERGLKARTKNWLGYIGGGIGLFSWLVVRSLNRKISGAPASINSAIKFTSDELFVGKSFRVLYQSGVALRKHGISSEFSFDVDYPKLVKIIDGACGHFHSCCHDHGLYQTSHIPVRFVQQSKAYLSPCYDGPKMFVDFPTLEDVRGRAEIMQFTQEYVVNKHDGVPHWGKVNDYIYGCRDFIKEHYPMSEKWREIRNKLDPKGTFLSDFVTKMGLR
ncbi:D-arabinono-1,4-lactone oxidase [Haliscomenobacter sp.]|uniref:D-arabinono-1,4-lactone oxidase n=1 Tax=Haliscomenobacter sp. TaxID=2717303 RepID=UPI003593B6EC